MEVKCKICGTINDGETNFCKGCFVKLDKELPTENVFNPKENEIVVPIEEEKEVEVPWAGNGSIEAEPKPIVELPSETVNSWEQPELKPMNELEQVNNNQTIFEPMIDMPVKEEIVPEVTEVTPVEEVTEVVEEQEIPLSPIEEVIEDLRVPEEIISESIEIPVEEIKEQTIEEIVPEVTEVTPVEEVTEVVEEQEIPLSPIEEVIEDLKVPEEIVSESIEIPVEEIKERKIEEIVPEVSEVTPVEEVTEVVEEQQTESIGELPKEEFKFDSEMVEDQETPLPPIEEVIEDLKVSEKVVPESVEIPVEKVKPVEEIVPETEKKSNAVMSVVGDNGENQIIENSIPELSNNEENNQTTELPELDMKQFEIPDEKETDVSWVDEVDEAEPVDMKYSYVGVGKLLLKYLMYCAIFGVIFGAICIGFRYAMSHIFNMGTKGELIFIVISSITSVATLLLASDRTLKKTVPLASKIDEASFLILMLVAVPYILIKIVFNLYIGTTLVILLVIVALSLIILALFFNYFRGNIRNKHELKGEDKLSFIYGIVSIVLVLGTLALVFMYKDKDYDISLDTLMNDTKNKEAVMEYVYQVEKTILKNQTEKDGYAIPNVISDVSYAEIDGKTPTEMTLYINENGGVVSGAIVYKGKTYKYNGKTIEA